MDNGIPERTIKELLNYFKSKPEIEKVVLYGSRAKGNFHIGSDIDFAIWTNEHDKITSILDDLENLPTPYKFDVTDYKILSHQGMKNNIDNDGILFYKKMDSK